MKYQYTNWDDPIEVLKKAGRIKDVTIREVLSESGFSASAGIDRIDYTATKDNSLNTAYIVWQSNNIDEVVYNWVTGNLTSYSAAKMLKMTGIYPSILKNLKKTIKW